jgi:hypothetical protein
MNKKKKIEKKQSLLGEREGPGGLSKTAVAVAVVRDLRATGGGSRESWLRNVRD